VRSRKINADKTTGMISSGAVTGHVNTGTSSPRAKNPTAKWAIGEMLITTGGVSIESFATPASCHWLRLR
jgi:hypothetical protein